MTGVPLRAPSMPHTHTHAHTHTHSAPSATIRATWCAGLAATTCVQISDSSPRPLYTAPCATTSIILLTL